MREERFLELVNRRADVVTLSTLSANQHQSHLGELSALLSHLDLHSAELREELCGIAALHPDPWLRLQVLQTLAPWCIRYEDVLNALVWLTHDPEDFVIFAAAQLCGQYRIREAAGDLMMLIGRPSERLLGKNGKPVGIGHVVVLDALIEILGTDDPDKLRMIEDEVKPPELTGELPLLAPSGKPLERRVAAARERERMVQVVGGPVGLRLPVSLTGQPLLFDWSDVIGHEQTIEVSTFFMDVYPVTCEEYDAFASSDAACDHRFCHPSEPPDKLHVRNTFLDRRFGRDHPAVGVDWFDAYAYAASVGKRLPTEWEWQRAAQGDRDLVYPWGNTFDGHHCRWFGGVVGRDSFTVPEWRTALYQFFRTDQSSPLTVPVHQLTDISPYGVVGLSGNCWEWTASNTITGQPLQPDVGEHDLVEVTKDWQSYPVIRGGAWSSLPEQLVVAFRGRDLLTDRHFENGFRCVCDAFE